MFNLAVDLQRLGVVQQRELEITAHAGEHANIAVYATEQRRMMAAVEHDLFGIVKLRGGLVRLRTFESDISEPHSHPGTPFRIAKIGEDGQRTVIQIDGFLLGARPVLQPAQHHQRAGAAIAAIRGAVENLSTECFG